MSLRQTIADKALVFDRWVSFKIWHDPVVTISSQIAMSRARGELLGRIGCPILNVIFNVPDHCAKALNSDEHYIDTL